MTLRVGVAQPFLMGDSCGRLQVPPACRDSEYWAIAGPRVGMRFSIEHPFTVEVGGLLGGMRARIGDQGWTSRQQVEVRANLAFGLDGPGLEVGGSSSFALGSLSPVSAQFGLTGRVSGVSRPPLASAGGTLHTRYVVLY